MAQGPYWPVIAAATDFQIVAALGALPTALDPSTWELLLLLSILIGCVPLAPSSGVTVTHSHCSGHRKWPLRETIARPT